MYRQKNTTQLLGQAQNIIGKPYDDLSTRDSCSKTIPVFVNAFLRHIQLVYNGQTSNNIGMLTATTMISSGRPSRQ